MRRKTLILIGVAAIVVAAVGFPLLMTTINRPRALYSAALRSLADAGEPVTLAAFEMPPIPNEQNAALDLKRAGEIVHGLDDQRWRSFDEIQKLRLPLTDKERHVMQRIVSEGAEALNLIDTALAKPKVDWGVQVTTPVIFADRPHLSAWRRLAQLLQCAALLAHDRGDDQQCTRRIMQMLDCGDRALRTDPTLVAHILAESFPYHAAETVQLVSPTMRIGTAPGEMSPQRALDLIQRLLDTSASSASLRRCMQFERFTHIDLVEWLVATRQPLSVIAGETRSTNRPASALERRVLYANALELLNYMNALLQSFDGLETDLPSWRAKHNFGWWSTRVNHEPYPMGVLAPLVPSGERSTESYFVGITHRRLAATTLALRLYVHAHSGSPPVRLEDLVPQYLPSVPLDALAAQTPLGYHPGPENPRIWSVGKDGIDHGGQEERPDRGAVWNSRNTDLVVQLRSRLSTPQRGQE